jgi:hypothetical protein
LCQRTANPPLRTEFLSASTKYISKLQDWTPMPTHHPLDKTLLNIVSSFKHLNLPLQKFWN